MHTLVHIMPEALLCSCFAQVVSEQVATGICDVLAPRPFGEELLSVGVSVLQ